ncbi:MAG: hypothetical protein ACPGN3_06610 [Opitutales bacterium]
MIRISVLSTICLISVIPGLARIGDNEQSLERRLTADRLAVEIRGDSAQRMVERGPLRRFLDLTEELEDAFEYRVYFKSANGERLSTTDAKGARLEDGWTYTGMFLKGVVVAETYERKKAEGDSRINPHEKKGLLIINQHSFAWDELDNMTLPSGEEVEGMTQYDYLRNDGKVFAKFERNHAIFMRKELDEKLREQRSIKNAEIDEEHRGALELSIAGF